MENYHFKFGHIRDNSPSLRIHKGRITLSNDELKPIFNDAVNKILNNCLDSLIQQKTQVIYHMPTLFILLMSSSMSFSLVDLQSRHMCEEAFHRR
jgi:hypothetical protein